MNNYQKAFLPSKELLTIHREELYKSGLADKTIKEIKVITSINRDSILFPVYDIYNKTIRGYRARYNNTVIEKNKYQSKNGETPKYRPSEGLGNVFYFPHVSNINWKSISADKSIAIFITEGEKKAAKLTQEGYSCIGLFGVYNWLSKKQDKKKKDEDEKKSELEEDAVEDFNLINWKGRTVYIIFDSDKYKNFNIIDAEGRLWKHLRALGANVKIINLPFDEGAKGVDDFWCKHKKIAKEKFDNLIQKATPVALGYINFCCKYKMNDFIPHYLAEYIHHEYRIINTQLGFHIYENGYYKKIDNVEYVKKIIKDLLLTCKVIPKTYFLNETVKLLNSYCLIDEKKFNPDNMHNVANGILELNTNTGEIGFEKHSPKCYFNYQAEVEYIPDINLEPSEDFLKKIIPDNNQRIIAYEALGVGIFPVCRTKVEFAKVTLEYGDGSNGKTKHTDFRRRILGNEICSSTPIDVVIDNTQRFAASTLYKKRANFSTENESSFIRESSILKQITSGKPGDELLVEFKHQQAFFAIVNPVMFFAINKPPMLPAARTPALERRIQIINYSNKFSSKPKDGELLADNRLENPKLTKDIVNGLLIVALKATKEMILRGHIWQEGVQETLKKAILEGSHKDKFLNEYVELDKESKIASAELHAAYVKFCLEEGVAEEHETKTSTKLHWADERYDKAAKKPAVLSKWLKERLKKNIQDTFVYNSDNKRVRGFIGLKLKINNTEDELINCASPNNGELGQNKPLNSCTVEEEDSFDDLNDDFKDRFKS